MIGVIHSADWQLGARFSQCGAKANQLRAARLTTLQKTLALAVSKQADAFLEGLGWKLHRIWSTDWWHDANQEMDKLIQRLKDIHPIATSGVR